MTSRHGPREEWNKRAIKRHCRISGQRLYKCPAEDTSGRNRGMLTMEERVTVAGIRIKNTARLIDKLDVAVGMKVMVMMNIATEVDIANGTWGTIEEIVLDDRERLSAEQLQSAEIQLQYPPALIIIQTRHPFRRILVSWTGQRTDSACSERGVLFNRDQRRQECPHSLSPVCHHRCICFHPPQMSRPDD